MHTVYAVQIHNYLEIVALTILYEDHLLTLPVKISKIWFRARTRAVFYFFLNRYPPFLCNIVVVIFSFTDLGSSSEKGCSCSPSISKFIYD
ncbi:hypothetical protein OF83DRAFT_1180191 [Amylostereum chailletii]|nr:hypothetical protein OF83DRAFT_1180191 [Amylostereum chailletii]